MGRLSWAEFTGYSRDILGELALLAFTYEQTRNRGIGYIVRKVERRMAVNGSEEISGFLLEVRRGVDCGRRSGRHSSKSPARDNFCCFSAGRASMLCGRCRAVDV